MWDWMLNLKGRHLQYQKDAVLEQGLARLMGHKKRTLGQLFSQKSGEGAGERQGREGGGSEVFLMVEFEGHEDLSRGKGEFPPLPCVGSLVMN